MPKYGPKLNALGRDLGCSKLQRSKYHICQEYGTGLFGAFSLLESIRKGKVWRGGWLLRPCKSELEFPTQQCSVMAPLLSSALVVSYTGHGGNICTLAMANSTNQTSLPLTSAGQTVMSALLGPGPLWLGGQTRETGQVNGDDRGQRSSILGLLAHREEHLGTQTSAIFPEPLQP